MIFCRMVKVFTKINEFVICEASSKIMCEFVAYLAERVAVITFFIGYQT